jgi:hypothetical protein
LHRSSLPFPESKTGRAPSVCTLAIASADISPEMTARNDTKQGLIGALPPNRTLGTQAPSRNVAGGPKGITAVEITNARGFARNGGIARPALKLARSRG